MSNNKQSSNHIPDVGKMVSSVEFIKNNLERLGILDNGIVFTNIFNQAKAMHKEEIIAAHFEGQCDITIGYPMKIAQQYYNETFNSYE